jgi:hypothetical protein
MANLCSNKIILVGEPETLKEIAHIVRHLFAEGRKDYPGTTTFESLQKCLDFSCKNWGRSYDDGLSMMEDNDVDAGKLTLHGTTAWSPIPDYFNALCEKFGLRYVYEYEADGEYTILGDKEGIWIPGYAIFEIWEENPYVDYSEEDFIEFDTKESFEDYCKTLGFTPEEFQEMLRESDFGAIRIIERDDTQIYPYEREPVKAEDIEEMEK